MAWLAVLALLSVLLGLAALLPAPTELLAVSGRGPAAVDAVVLAGTALLVWALTAWVAMVAAVAAFGVLPGAAGRQARRLLRLIAPRLALRLVAVAVGASALAGTTACSAPIFASTAASDSASVSMTTPSPQVFDPAAPATATVPAAGGPTGSGDGSAVISDPVVDPVAIDPVVIDIDWPSSTTSPSGSIDVPVSGTADPTPTPSPATTLPAPASSPSATVITPASPAGGTTAAAPRPAQADPAPTSGSSDDSRSSAAGAPVGATADPRSGDGTEVRPTRPSGEPVVVQPGDTLWALAADALPTGADDAVVDAAWRQWYALNRAVIGDDPDLLQPGEHLTPPPVDPPTAEENHR